VIAAEVIVKKDALTNVLLGLIASRGCRICAIRMVRGQVYGKVVVDLRSGKIWGFPTGTVDPYPSYPLDSKPSVSKPFALGRYAFEDTEK